MNDATWRRVGAVAGIVFGVLVVLAFAAMGDSPEFVDDPETISTFFADNEGKIFVGAILTMLAAFSLVWFVSALRDALVREVGDAGTTPVVVIAIGGAIAASAYAISGAILAVGAARVQEHGVEGSASALVNWDVFMVVFGAAAPIGLAALLTGVAALSFGAVTLIPRWLGGVSLPLALVGLIPPIAYTLTFGIAAWSIIVAILMFRHVGAGVPSTAG